MKKLLCLILAFCILTTNLSNYVFAQSTIDEIYSVFDEEINSMSSLGDSRLLNYIENAVYRDLVLELDSDEYFVENVDAIYISKEYLEELEYNSQANVFYGYTLDEIDQLYDGTRYAFTLGEDQNTTVIELPLSPSENPYLTMLKDVATGSGVILLLVTISAVTPTIPSLSVIFAGSATSAAKLALSTSLISGATQGLMSYYQTGDAEYSLGEAAKSAGTGFKWGAIGGAIAGAAGKAKELYGLTRNGLTLNEAALIQKESRLPVDIIKDFSSVQEYQVYKDSGLNSVVINERNVLLSNDINWTDIITDSSGKKMTNLDRLRANLNPVDEVTGQPYNIHHVGQKADGTFALLKDEVHKQASRILHKPGRSKNLTNTEWNKQRREFLKDLLKFLEVNLESVPLAS